jgi:hypothetical protein
MVDAKYRFLSWPVSAAVGLGCSWYPSTEGFFSTMLVGGTAFYPVLVVGSDKFFAGCGRWCCTRLRTRQGAGGSSPTRTRARAWAKG